MKTTKIWFRPHLVVTLLTLSLMTGCFFSCDTLEPDSDLLAPKVQVSAAEVYAYANNSTFIDLSSAVKTNLPVRFSITAAPKYGTLTDLGQGILQYTPGTKTNTRDGFGFAVFSDNTIIKTDTITIAIGSDSTSLPCGIFPADDHVFGVQPNVPVVIPVLANDFSIKSYHAGLNFGVVLRPRR